MKYYDFVEKTTKDLVHIESIVRQGNETNAAKYVYDFWKSLPYFQENPDDLILQKTQRDEVDRHSTICLIQGKGNSKRTMVLLGHIDTVGVDDYLERGLSPFDPDLLEEELKDISLPKEVKEDLDSGEYLFGRGALDMKSGVAGHMAIGKYFTEHLDELNGNLVLLAECDEEDGSRGVITALSQLVEWKEKYDLEFVGAINADYSTPYYPKDPNRYLYLGTIGKLLPTFYVTGSEAHVGQAFAGFDPNLLLAEITRMIDLNTDLSDTAQGETTIPPMSLRARDTKEGYTVQTALRAYGYYNFFTHGMSPEDVMEKMVYLAEDAFDKTIEYLNQQYKIHCEKTGFHHEELPWKRRVYSWEEYQQYLTKIHPTFPEEIQNFGKELHKKDPQLDMRDFAIMVMEEAFTTYDNDKSPLVLVSFTSVYSQNIELTGEDPNEKRLIESVRSGAETFNDAFGPIEVKYFYPYISDSSFLYYPKDGKGMDALAKNMPSWEVKYHHPLEEVKNISMPVVNIGTYGLDGHRWTERVHKRFTFEGIPLIAEHVIREML
ncbi:MAG: M20/M25/M40 family metallo-hydrolase [Tissierellia bacterium]|nr:M20/M25/M40 family metallo-hydrolase [Tissierellia bacterium]